jgi:hypothetical protein
MTIQQDSGAFAVPTTMVLNRVKLQFILQHPLPDTYKVLSLKVEAHFNLKLILFVKRPVPTHS